MKSYLYSEQTFRDKLLFFFSFFLSCSLDTIKTIFGYLKVCP